MKGLFKGLLGVSIALLSVVLLVGCGTKTKEVPIFIYQFSDPFIATVRNALEAEFNKSNIKHNFYDGNNTQTTQTQQIKSSIAKKVPLLIVNIVDPASAQPIVDEAKAKDIPVIFFNREVADSVIRSYDKSAFVGTDPDKPGHLQGEFIANELINNFDKYDKDGNGRIQYMLLRGEVGNPEADGRTTYSVKTGNEKFKEAWEKLTREQRVEKKLPASLHEDGVLQILGKIIPAEWSAAKAKDAVASGITSFGLTKETKKGDGPIEMIISNNDEMASGAITALNAQGFNNEVAKDGQIDYTKYVIVTGVDATETGINLFKKKKLSYTVILDGVKLADLIVKLAKNALNGNATDMLKGTDIKYTASLKDQKAVNKVRISYEPYVEK